VPFCGLFLVLLNEPRFFLRGQLWIHSGGNSPQEREMHRGRPMHYTPRSGVQAINLPAFSALL